MAADVPFKSSELVPRRPAAKMDFSSIQSEHFRTDRLILKFAEGTGVRLRSGSLVSTAGVDVSRAVQVIESLDGIAVRTLIRRSEDELDRARINGMAASNRRGRGTVCRWRHHTVADRGRDGGVWQLFRHE